MIDDLQKNEQRNLYCQALQMIKIDVFFMKRNFQVEKHLTAEKFGGSSQGASPRPDCEQSLSCTKIRGEKEAEHDSRARSETSKSMSYQGSIFKNGRSCDRHELSKSFTIAVMKHLQSLFSLVFSRARYSRDFAARAWLLFPRGFSSKRETARSQ